MSGSATLAIATTSLAGANACETDYSQTLTGAGRTSSFNWSILSRTLLKGLNLNGSFALISGNVSASAVNEIFTLQLSYKSGLATTR